MIKAFLQKIKFKITIHAKDFKNYKYMCSKNDKILKDFAKQPNLFNRIFLDR